MKKWCFAACLAAALAACSSGGGILPDGAVELSENRVSRFTGSDGRFYDMRTYMVPNDNVFYVTVAASGRQLAFEEGKRNAGSTASAYIRQRSCSGDFSRLSSRDVYDPASKVWTIVVRC